MIAGRTRIFSPSINCAPSSKANWAPARWDSGMQYRRILILGATGLLGQAFVKEMRGCSMNVRTAARSDTDMDLDVADIPALERAIDGYRPDLIVNCAALVDINACERDPGLAYRVNAAPACPAGEMVERGWCQTSPCFRTDHFFADETSAAHSEDAPVTLFNQYAATKFAGEKFALLCPGALVLRTSIVGIRGWDAPTFCRMGHCSGAGTARDDLVRRCVHLQHRCRRFRIGGHRNGATLTLAACIIWRPARFIRKKPSFVKLPLPWASRLSTQPSVRSARSRLHGRRTWGLDVSKASPLLERDLPDMKAVVRALISDYRSKP